MVSYPKGKEILDLVQKEIQVKMTIGVGTHHVQFISGQSVMFVAIAFITMVIISLAWLILYYIQRFLYTGSQFESQSHRKETKKVIGQLPLHTIKHEETGELEDVQEMPTPESAPGSVSAANVSITVQDYDRSDGSNSPSPSTNESMYILKKMQVKTQPY